MPRLRRSARERRQQPQLAAEVWEWLQGKLYERLQTGTKWDLLVLPSHDHDWRDRICEAVEAGEIEISADKIHRMGDEPLLPAIVNRGQRASRQERSDEAMERASDSEAESLCQQKGGNHGYQHVEPERPDPA
jgi:hypothetical protein